MTRQSKHIPMQYKNKNYIILFCRIDAKKRFAKQVTMVKTLQYILQPDAVLHSECVQRKRQDEHPF